jgi:hypothetical protein
MTDDVRKVVQKKIRRSGNGVNIAADVNAVVATSTGKSGGGAAVSRRQSVRVVQKNGHTEVTEEISES